MLALYTVHGHTYMFFLRDTTICDWSRDKLAWMSVSISVLGLHHFISDEHGDRILSILYLFLSLVDFFPSLMNLGTEFFFCVCASMDIILLIFGVHFISVLGWCHSFWICRHNFIDPWYPFYFSRWMTSFYRFFMTIIFRLRLFQPRWTS